jgi:DNA mismatch repair protein MutS
MSFITDKQTLDDLNVLGKYKNKSVFNLFNETKTAGGERLLEQMFQQPLTDLEQINTRSQLIRYFQERKLTFPFDLVQLQQTEQYLNSASASNLPGVALQGGRRKILSMMGLNVEYNLIRLGLEATVQILFALRDFVSNLLKEDAKSPFAVELERAAQVLQSPKMTWLSQASASKDLSFFQSVRYDYLLRASLREEMRMLMQLLHRIDLYTAVATVSAAKSFSYAKALPEGLDFLSIEQGFHPCLEKAVPNSVLMDQDKNVIFLTGANMAGKSTFMKSFGICIYLAHMGFPVPAASMSFSVKEGMYTSINVPDDLNMGYSHFYAEVLRVKKIAEEISSPKNLYLIFDELFKGTNVKDAYDATLAVSEAFEEYRNCFFIISTHIVEVGEVLGQRCSNIIFTYMPTEMQGKIPSYTYQARTGISSDRHGMMIIENEGILDIIG